MTNSSGNLCEMSWCDNVAFSAETAANADEANLSVYSCKIYVNEQFISSYIDQFLYIYRTYYINFFNFSPSREASCSYRPPICFYRVQLQNRSRKKKWSPESSFDVCVLIMQALKHRLQTYRPLNALLKRTILWHSVVLNVHINYKIRYNSQFFQTYNRPT